MLISVRHLLRHQQQEKFERPYLLQLIYSAPGMWSEPKRVGRKGTNKGMVHMRFDIYARREMGRVDDFKFAIAIAILPDVEIEVVGL